MVAASSIVARCLQVLPPVSLTEASAGNIEPDLLESLDTIATWWPRGLLSACQRLAEHDQRYRFCLRFYRSARFGLSVVRSLEVGWDLKPSPRARDAAVLMNLFITAFDGICDDVPELLPHVLPAVSDAANRFPDPTADAPLLPRHPLAAFAVATANAFSRIVGSSLGSRSDSVRDTLASSVRNAFNAQVSSLSTGWVYGEPANILVNRSTVSATTLQVAVLLPLAFHDITADLETLRRCGCRVGEFFGWVDDTVDLNDDLLANQPNAIAVTLSTHTPRELAALPDDDGSIGVVVEQTRVRWHALQAATHAAGLHNPATSKTLALAARAWLGDDPWVSHRQTTSGMVAI